MTYLSTETTVVSPSRRTFLLERALRIISLGRNHHALPRNLVLFQEFPEDHLGFACRVDIGGVECLSEDEIISVKLSQAWRMRMETRGRWRQQVELS